MKTKPAPKKRPAQKAPAPAVPHKHVVRVELVSFNASFFRDGEGEPYSRKPYGPPGSDGRNAVDAEIADLRAAGVEVVVS